MLGTHSLAAYPQQPDCRSNKTLDLQTPDNKHHVFFLLSPLLLHCCLWQMIWLQLEQQSPTSHPIYSAVVTTHKFLLESLQACPPASGSSSESITVKTVIVHNVFWTKGNVPLQGLELQFCTEMGSETMKSHLAFTSRVVLECEICHFSFSARLPFQFFSSQGGRWLLHYNNFEVFKFFQVLL